MNDKRFVALACALAVLAVVVRAAEFTIISTSTVTQVVNNKTRQLHTATVECTEPGLFSYTVSNPAGGGTAVLHVECKAPKYTYTRQLVGYVPRYLPLHRDTVCFTGHARNTTEIAEAVSGSLTPTVPDSVPSPTRRRLLMATVEQLASNMPGFRDGYEHVRVGRKLLWTPYPNSYSAGRLAAGGDAGAAVSSKRFGKSMNALGKRAVAKNAEGGVMKVGAGDLFKLGATDFLATTGGVIVGMLIANFFIHGGGDGGLPPQFIHSMEKHLHELQNFEHHQLAWDTEAQTEISLNREFAEDAAHQADINADGIVFLNNSINQISKTVTTIWTESTKEFNSVLGDINAIENQTDAVTVALLSFHAEVEAQFQKIVDGFEMLDRANSDQEVIMEQLYYDTFVRRQVIQSFFNTTSSGPPGFEGTLEPFLPATEDGVDTPGDWVGNGRKPMTLSERNTHHTYAGSVIVGETYVQYTAGTTLTEHVFSFRCDPEFLLNYTISDVGFKGMFYQIGPDAYNGTKCFDTGDSETETWRCRCVIGHSVTSCQEKAPAVDWPWTDGKDFKTLAEAHTGADVCFAIPAVAAPALSIVTSFDEWKSTFPATYCPLIKNDASGTKSTKTISTGTYDVRIASIYSPRTAGVDINAIFDQCATNQTFMALGENSFKSLAFNIHNMWRLGYNLVAATLLPNLETQWFGQAPTDIKDVEYKFPRDIGITNAKKCNDVFYSKIYRDAATPADEKLAIYAFSPSGVELQSTVRINDQVTPTPITETGVTLPLDNSDLNVVLSSNHRITTAYENLLPGTFYSIGDWDNDPKLGAKIVDAPFSSMDAQGSSTTRCGRITYAFQDRFWNNATHEDAQIIIEEWKQMNNMPWDPECAMDHAYRYLRGIDANGFCTDKWWIGDSPSGGTTYGTVGSDNELCTLFRSWKYEIEAGGSKLTLTPRAFAEVWTFETPGEHFTEYVLSLCPSGYRVGISDNQATLYLTTHSEDDVQIEYTMFASTSASISTKKQKINKNKKTIKSNRYVVTAAVGAVGCTHESGFSGVTTVPGGGAEHAVLNFGACNVDYHVNVRPVGSVEYCYPGNGIDLNVTAHVADAQPFPPAITRVIEFHSSQVAAEMVTSMTALAEMMATVMQIPIIAENDADVEARIAAASAAAKAVISNSADQLAKSNKIIAGSVKKMHDAVDRMNAELTKNMKKFRQFVADEKENSEEFHKLHEESEESLSEISVDVAEDSATIDQLEKELAAMGASHKCKFEISKPSTWLKGIWCYLMKLFNDVVMWVLYGLAIFLGIYCCIMFGPEIFADIMNGGCNCFRGASKKHTEFQARRKQRYTDYKNKKAASKEKGTNREMETLVPSRANGSKKVPRIKIENS